MSTDESVEIERQEALRLANENFGDEAEVHRRFDPGTHGSHEAADRLWIQGENVEYYIQSHPTVAMNKDAYEKVFKARELLMEAYQLIACADPE